MTLGALLRAVAGRAPFDAGGDSRAEADRAAATVASIAYDSREVTRGAVFVALRGLHADGAAFAREAHRARRRRRRRRSRQRRQTSSVAVAAGRATRGWRWRRCRRRSTAIRAASCALVGITGTNGKTTTTYLLAVDLRGRRHPVRSYRHRRLSASAIEERDAARTTPEAPDAAAAAARDGRPRARRLRRWRCRRTRWRCGASTACASPPAIFTNLTRDHLDFHGDMEDVLRGEAAAVRAAAAEARRRRQPRRSARRRAARGRRAAPVTYAIDAAADVTPGPLSFSLDGLAFDVRTPRGALHVRSSLVGRPNVYNILAAVAAAVALDLPFDAIERGVAALTGRSRPLRGRLRRRRRRPRRRRLRAHRRRAAEPARDGAAAGARPLDHGVRLRRRSRSHQAAVDGRGRRRA